MDHERSRDGFARPVSIDAMCARDTPTAAASSAWVMSSMTRVSRHKRAKEMRNGLGTRQVKPGPLTSRLLDRL